MKKVYEQPELELLVFRVADVITESEPKDQYEYGPNDLPVRPLN